MKNSQSSYNKNLYLLVHSYYNGNNLINDEKLNICIDNCY